MKKKHLSVLEKHFPDALPKIYQALKDNGLPDFLIKTMELIHEDDHNCPRQCNDDEVCVQVLRGAKLVWDCQPKMDE